MYSHPGHVRCILYSSLAGLNSRKQDICTRRREEWRAKRPQSSWKNSCSGWRKRGMGQRWAEGLPNTHLTPLFLFGQLKPNSLGFNSFCLKIPGLSSDLCLVAPGDSWWEQQEQRHTTIYSWLTLAMVPNANTIDTLATRGSWQEGLWLHRKFEFSKLDFNPS